MSRYLDVYLTDARLAVASLAQYRVANLLWLTGMAAEPVIYLVVWTTVAEAQGGEVAGWATGAFTSYYIVWTLVRQMNIALTPWAFEERVQQGTLSPMLLLPIHPFHRDMGWFAGFKIVTFLLWLPIGAGLYLIFRPPLDPTAVQVITFLVSLVTAYTMRFVILWALGMLTFWMTRVSAVFDLFFAVELLLSGRLVPMDLLPGWAQALGKLLPFQWAFGFPIEVLLGRLSASEIVLGFGAQYIWFLIGAGAAWFLWHKGVGRYTAVGA